MVRAVTRGGLSRRRFRTRRGAVLAVLWSGAFLGAPPLAAQAVVGTVTEEGSGRPVVGAMVRLVRDGRPTAVRFLTADDGRYRLLLPEPGRYQLEVDRIGFGRVRAGPVTVEEAATATFDIRVSTAPIRLEGLAVEGRRRRCSLEPGEEGRTQVVWDQARKALAAASWTASEAGLTFEIARRVRQLDMDGEAVVDEGRQVSRGRGGNSVRTLSPEELAEGGWVRDEGGYLYYYGPDAGVLLSDIFLRTHCFTLRDDGRVRDGLVGLDFEPVPDRDTTDIRGTMWLEGGSLRLERVEFGYTGLPRLPGNDLARGQVTFLELADGRWIVRDWFIQAPILTVRRAMGAVGRMEDRLMVTAVQEFGSEVIRVEDDGGLSWTAERPRGGVEGVVWDSVAGGPMAGTEVRLAGRAWRTTTDREGRWALAGIPPGVYRVGFAHPLLDSLDADVGWREVEVRPDTVVRVALALPPYSTLLAAGCPRSGAGVVVGFVRDPSGAPVVGAQVAVVEGVDPAGRPPPVSTDAAGAFRICDLPVDVDLRVQARSGPLRSAAEDARTRGGSAVRVDLRLQGG